MSHVTLDCRRLLCPLPVIRVQDKIATLATGDVLAVVCTDPGVLNDIPAWCRINGHRLLETRAESGEYLVMMEIKTK